MVEIMLLSERENYTGLLPLTFSELIIHLVRSQNFQKTNISYPLPLLLRLTRTCAYQRETNVSFSEKIANVLNE